MNLTNEQIKSILSGTMRVEEKNGALYPRRFNERQQAIYDLRGINKARASSAMRLSFTTDSDHVTLSYSTAAASSRDFAFYDAYVDGKLVLHHGHERISAATSSLSFALPEGTHAVTIYLPNLFETVIHSLGVDDGATVTPIKRKLRYFAFGDSITQGYDATYSAGSYVNLLADALDAEVTNFAIGGETFIPQLIDFDDSTEEPDLITVAYGTNDWSHVERDTVIATARDFYARLRARFPHAKIFAFTPIWRADCDRVTSVGALPDSIADLVTEAATAQKDITVIRGWNFVPHVPELFSDLYLHPNDMGFKCYAATLLEEMKPHLGDLLK